LKNLNGRVSVILTNIAEEKVSQIFIRYTRR